MKQTNLNRMKVSDIMQGNKKALLLHAEKKYLLSITRRGKLILTSAENSNDQLNSVPSGDIRVLAT